MMNHRVEKEPQVRTFGTVIRVLLSLLSVVAPGAFLVACSKAPSFGDVHVTVSYLQRSSLGTHLDVGANVVLIPESVKKRLLANLMPECDYADFQETSDRMGAVGVYIARVDGHGDALFPKVVPGSYRLVIVSRHKEPASEDEEKGRQIIEHFFVTDSKDVQGLDGTTPEEKVRALEWALGSRLVHMRHEVHARTVKVDAGAKTVLSHNF